MDDTISKKDAIDALKICDNNEDGINCHKCPLRDERWDGAWENDETTCYRKLMRDSAKLLESPLVEPETSILTMTVAPNPEEIERVVRKIKDAPVTVLPPVQPEIIYCKDCEHLKRSETSSKLMMCQRRGRLLNLVGEFDFCSKAERRTDG